MTTRRVLIDENKVRQAHFEVEYSRDEKEDIMLYNDIMDYLSRDDNEYDGSYWAFRKIIGHQRVHQGDPDYNGSSYNLRISWENGDETIERLKKQMG